MRSVARIAATFARARWGYRFANRDQLLSWQQQRVNRFLDTHLERATFYREYTGARLRDLPIVDKATMLANFDGFNVAGITLDRAISVAEAAERTRDFAPTIDGLTVGLSSGTSGTRGVFLVSAKERDRWVGLTLARVLTPATLRRLLDPTRQPIRVAFFLRANSNLYESLGSRRLRFAFYDLIEPTSAHVQRLNEIPPDVLVAPPTVLRRLAEMSVERQLRIAPRQVVSVAEVVEPDDRVLIEKAFGLPLQEVYQATEGFLGASCPAGRVHLNEEFVHVEPEWLDGEQRRFRPIITDFTRTTQLVVRYRLDDVLLDAATACACGRVTRRVDSIEGRIDDVLWSLSLRGEDTPIFPDVIRRSMTLASAGIREYRIEQRGETWHLRLDVRDVAENTAAAAVQREIEALCDRLGVQRPVLRFESWREDAALEKRRRIRCLEKPSRHGVAV